ncbi:DUF3289 family protein [Massilia sp. W12]|uniref:DUF3289 family protein n=1 Tax=Massilia sp. W12 TaxID=3126507 RepID=UPI0030D38F3E
MSNFPGLSNSPLSGAGALAPGAQLTPGDISRFGSYLNMRTLAQPLLLAQSQKKPGRNYNDTGLADDLRYGDYSAEQIRALRWNFRLDFIEHLPARTYFASLREMASLFSMGNLQINIQKMIDHFQGSSGCDFSSKELNTAIAGHHRYLKFSQEVLAAIHPVLKKRQGDPNKIVVNEDFQIKSKLVFNDKSDIAGGLTIAINDVWAWRVELTGYGMSGKEYAGTLRISLFDHFGLDVPDVDYSKVYGNLGGFRAWFILQHYVNFAYKPFITKAVFDYPFAGSLA